MLRFRHSKTITILLILILSTTSFQVNALTNEQSIKVNLDGRYIFFDEFTGFPFIDNNGRVLLPLRVIAENIGVDNIYYDTAKKTAILHKDVTTAFIPVNKKFIVVEDLLIENDSEAIIKDGRVYLPIRVVMEAFGYTVGWDNLSRTAIITEKKQEIKEDISLPGKFDLRQVNRVTSVKQQGDIGACWAFAALGAFESSLLPKERFDFSEDNMSLKHGFDLNQKEGGDNILALSYLTRWDGPVLEKDDKYGDQIAEDIPAVKHLQEAINIPERDINSIKKAIVKYGGVQSSVYSPFEGNNGNSGLYYNQDTYAMYNYDAHESNHDIVIVGWDDNYSTDNFYVKPEGNGAFICKNSWGEDFGEDGYYYVSYYDNNIARNNIAYSRIDNPDNYDNIYQYDELGMIGETGYNNETAYFSNVFEAEKDEKLDAVSFYTTGNDTSYTVYVVNDFDENKGFKELLWLEEGVKKHSGYYTIDLSEDIYIKKGTKFAIVVCITTPGDNHPVAVEFKAVDQKASDVEVNPNESYISYDGIHWEDAGEKYNSNVCLKAFTSDIN